MIHCACAYKYADTSSNFLNLHSNVYYRVCPRGIHVYKYNGWQLMLSEITCVSLVAQIIEYAVNLDDRVLLCHSERQTQEYKDAK